MASLNNLEGRITGRNKLLFNIKHPTAPIWIAVVQKTIGLEKSSSTYVVLECFTHVNETEKWSNGVISYNRVLCQIGKNKDIAFPEKFEVSDYDNFKFEWRVAFQVYDKYNIYELLVEVELPFIYQYLKWN